MFPGKSIAYKRNVGGRYSIFFCQFINIFFSVSTPSYFSNLRFGEFGHSMFFSLIKVGASIVSWVKIFKVFNSVISYSTIFMTNFISFWTRTNKCLSHKDMGGNDFFSTFEANGITKVSASKRVRLWHKANVGSFSWPCSHQSTMIANCVETISPFNWFPNFRLVHAC